MRHAALISVLFALAIPALAGTGDVNNDTKVTVADAALALKIAGGLTRPTAAQQFAADVSPDAPDGAVRISDAVRIARIAAGLDPKMPASAMPVSFALTVSGSGTRNFTLAGGHSVSGKLTTSSGAVFTGSIAFADTTTGDVYGSWVLDTTTGAFSAVLPTGKYQPIAITQTSTEPAMGEYEDTDLPQAVGSILTVTGPVSGLTYKRGTVPSTYKLTVTYSGTTPPYGRDNVIHFTDTGATPASYGLNRVVRDVLNTPGYVGMPKGTYYIESSSQHLLSSGLYEDLSIIYYNTLTISGAKSTTLNYPKMYELSGVITAPTAYPATHVYAENRPTGTADSVAVYVAAGSSGEYLISSVPGSTLLDIILQSLSSTMWSTDIDYLLPYTMPAATTRKNITVPVLPVFRTITGVVKTPTGGKASNVGITAKMNLATVPATGAYVFTGYAVTDANGTYTLTLPDGSYTVTATP